VADLRRGVIDTTHCVVMSRIGEDSSVKREGDAALEMAKDRPAGTGRPF
jgi:hypothetical protein